MLNSPREDRHERNPDRRDGWSFARTPAEFEWSIKAATWAAHKIRPAVLPVLKAADDRTQDQADAIAIAFAATLNTTVAQIVGLHSPARLMDTLLFVGGQGLQWRDAFGDAA